MWIPEHFLNDDTYIIGIALSTMIPARVHFYEPEALMFEVMEDISTRDTEYNQKISGVIRPRLNWETIQISKK